MTRTRRRPAQLSRRPPAGVAAAGACFLLYFLLLVTSEILRPGPSGLHARFGRDGADVVSVQPGSLAAQAGLQPGDRIRTAAGRPLHTRQDWFSVSANMRPGEPLSLVGDRGGVPLTAAYVPSRQLLSPTTIRVDTVALLATRAVQFSGLVLALVITWRRPDDGLAWLTAWLLASFSAFTLLLPYGFARLWRLVPFPLQPLLWGPYLSSVAAPAIFFAFAAEFPRPYFQSRRVLLAWCAPALLQVVWHAWLLYVIVYRQGWIPMGTDWSWLSGLLNVVYLLAGLVMLVVQYRRLDQIADQRRLRVLLAGTSVGLLGGAIVSTLFVFGRDPRFTSSLFASPVMIVAVPLLAIIPASMAYTILRHRWFGLGFIVRQGVRYALARRLLLSLIPVLLGILAVDLFVHRDRPLGEMVPDRWWWYGLAAAALVTLLVNRRRWLVALDRRFFHEHYRAEQILQSVAQQLRQSSDPGQAVAAVVQQVDRALQPAFVGALGWREGHTTSEVLAATPSFPDSLELDTGSRLVALAGALDRPLDVSPDQDVWLARHVPATEAATVADNQLELLVPVSSGKGHDLMLVLGPRRSEEPYSAQDTDLLRAIASSLALVLERAGPAAEEPPSLAECPACAACFDTNVARCPNDGTLLLVSGIPRVLGGRYALRARIGAGGMGTVYSARDESLGRNVAVKVLGEHLVGSTDAARRFQHEAQAAASFTHPHVVTVHDFGVTANHRAFLVMEQLEGYTLREEIERGPMSAERTLAIVTDLCDVLTVAHGRGLVHRDLKPENVFLTGGAAHGTKVLDFGIAKAVSDPAARTATGTSSGVLIGTLPYMSPEQLRGETVHPSWDLWALGVMCQEMLTAQRPVTLPVAQAPDAVGETAITASLEGPRLSPALRSFFARALALDRPQRPDTAAAFREQLAAALTAGT